MIHLFAKKKYRSTYLEIQKNLKEFLSDCSSNDMTFAKSYIYPISLMWSLTKKERKTGM